VAWACLSAVALATALAAGFDPGTALAGGSKLRWLPYRPTMPDDSAVVQTSARWERKPGERPAPAKRPTHVAQQDLDSILDNPFGQSGPNGGFDRPATREPAELPGKPGATRSDPSPLQPSPTETDSDDGDPAYGGPRWDDSQLDAGLQPDYPSLDQEFGQPGPELEYDCPSRKELKPIEKISWDIRPEAGELPKECSLERDPYTPRSFAMTTFHWKASGLCHKPLYFEDVQLERYGHSWGPYLQPFVSGAHFFVTLPVLPYKMGMYPPHECMYTLGYYRPGNCAPYMLDPIPLSVRGGLAEAGAVLGAVYLIP